MSDDHDAYEQHDNPTIRPQVEKIKTKRLLVSDMVEMVERSDTSSETEDKERPWRISITVVALDAQLVADLKQTLILGRAFPSPKWVGIDLAPFGAFDHGVSRKHAVMSLESNQIVIHDEGSLNGTFLNGKQLKPKVPYVLHTGDFVSLGQFELRIDLMHNPFDL